MNATERANIILGFIGLGLNGLLVLVGAVALVRDWHTNRLGRSQLTAMAEEAKRLVAAEQGTWQVVAEQGEAWTRQQR